MKTNKLTTQREMQREIAENKIAAYLSDGKKRQYSEIIKNVNLSRATISKHLKEMEKTQKIFKTTDHVSGKYPYPVYYQINPDTKTKIKNQFTDLLTKYDSITEKELEKIDTPEKLQLVLSTLTSGVLPLFENIEYFKQNKKPKKSILIYSECASDFMFSIMKKCIIKYIERDLVHYSGGGGFG